LKLLQQTLSIGQLSIPQVIVGNTKYFDLIANLGSLISGGDLTSTLATTNLNLRPDTFYLKKSANYSCGHS
jgi:hypothetical protein